MYRLDETQISLARGKAVDNRTTLSTSTTLRNCSPTQWFRPHTQGLQGRHVVIPTDALRERFCQRGARSRGHGSDLHSFLFFLANGFDKKSRNKKKYVKQSPCGPLQRCAPL